MQASNYDPIEFDRQWASAVRRNAAGTKGISIATLIRRARQGGYNATPTITQTRRPRLLLSDGDVTLPLQPPPSRDHVWEKLFFVAKYAVLAGPGGVSKTMLALGLATQIALGEPWAGLKTGAGGAMLFLGEEDADEVRRRLGAIARNRPPAERQLLEQRIRAFPMAGKDLRLTQLDQHNAMATGFDDDIIALAGEFTLIVGKVSLIVIDHARLAMGGDPNAADHVTGFTRLLTHIADETGAAVLLLAHSPKSTLSKEDETNAVSAADIAGSSAFVDNARCAMMLTTIDAQQAKKFGIPLTARQSYVRLKVVKNNYGPTGLEIWFQRRHDPDYEVAVLEPMTMQPVSKATLQTKQALDDKIVELVKRAPTLLTPTKLRSAYSGKSGVLGAAESEVEDAVRRLVANGRLELRCPTLEERQEHNIHKNAKRVLWPGDVQGKVQGEGRGA
jgi:hypothetical protein